MRWLRNLLERPPPRRPAAQRRPFCPRLEGLEERCVLNTSTVYDALGHRTVFAVYTNDSLYRYDDNGVQILATANVLRVHGYLQPNGQVGVIVMYDASLNFMAFDYDSAGGHFLGDHIVDCAKAYDKDGHIQEDVTYNVGAGFATFEYTDTSARMLDNGPNNVAILIHPFRDGQGHLGQEVEYFDSVTTNTVIEYDSTGARFMAKDAGVDKNFAPDGQHFVIDVAYISSNQGFEYSNLGVLFLGSNIGI
jgi:hypothetical protein